MIKQAYNELAASTSGAGSRPATYEPTNYTVLTPAQALAHAVEMAGAALPAEMSQTVAAIQRDLSHEPVSADRMKDAGAMIGHVLDFVETQQEKVETVPIPGQLSPSEQMTLQTACDALADSDPHGLALGAIRALLTHADAHAHELAA